MNKPTLLHIFPTFAVGGSQARFAVIANRLAARFRHVVVAIDGRDGCRERLAAAVDVSFSKVVLRRRDLIGNVRKFRALFEELRPHRLITHNWGSIEAAMANWPKVCGHLHIEDGFGPEEASRQLRRRILTRRLVLSRSTVILPSRHLCSLAKEVWRLNAGNLRYVPNGVDCDRYRVEGNAPCVWEGDGPIIGTVAALRPEKNLRRLLDAFRLVRAKLPCRLLIAGDGPQRASLEAHAVALGLGDAVRFAGHINRTETIYPALAGFVLSSDTEQMPSAVLEAMASGRAVVATDVGDVKEMVSELNQPLIVPKDAAALAEAVLRLLSDPALAAQIGGANRIKACNLYGEDRMVKAYETLYGGMP